MSGGRKPPQCYVYFSVFIGLVGATLERGQSSLLKFDRFEPISGQSAFVAASFVVDGTAGYFSALERNDHADYTVIMSTKRRHSNLNRSGKAKQ